MLRTFTAFILSLAIGSTAFAQSQAINGTIEGTVVDAQGAVLPGVTVTVANIDTGDQRVVVTNESGLFRAPLLTLGSYRVAAELQGFRNSSRPACRCAPARRPSSTSALDGRRGRGNDHRHRRFAARRSRRRPSRAAR